MLNQEKEHLCLLLIKYHLFKFFPVFRTHFLREQMFSLNYFAKRDRDLSTFSDTRIISAFKRCSPTTPFV